MAINDTPPQSLQESILTVLVFDERFEAQIAAQVTPQHFDDPSMMLQRECIAKRDGGTWLT